MWTFDDTLDVLIHKVNNVTKINILMWLLHFKPSDIPIYDVSTTVLQPRKSWKAKKEGEGVEGKGVKYREQERGGRRRRKGRG